jgi:hypothetical protein
MTGHGGGRRLALAVMVVGLMTGAAGCSGDSPSSSATRSTTTATIGGPSTSATASASPSASASASSDRQAQAYAAATKVYNDFFTGIVRTINSGADPTRLRGISRGEAFSYAVVSGREAEAHGYKVEGTISMVYVRPKSFTYGGSTANPSKVGIDGCQDLRTVRYVDRNGKPVPRGSGAADFLRYTVTAVNFTPSVSAGWVLDDFKNVKVPSCA